MTNLTWLHNKIKSTGCVQLLLDINLTSPPKYQQSESQSPDISKPKLHLDFLKKFLQNFFRPLNYDAQQIYSLLSTNIKQQSLKRSDVAQDAIIQGWRAEIEEGSVVRIEKISEGNEEQEVGEQESEGNENGYDFLINTNRDENFVISLSTDREEICVWDVLK